MEQTDNNRLQQRMQLIIIPASSLLSIIKTRLKTLGLFEKKLKRAHETLTS